MEDKEEEEEEEEGALKKNWKGEGREYREEGKQRGKSEATGKE